MTYCRLPGPSPSSRIFKTVNKNAIIKPKMCYTIWDFVQKVFKDSGKIWVTPAPAFLTQFYTLKSDQMLLFCIATWMPLKSTVDPLLAGFVVRSNSGWSFGISFCNDCRNANSSFHFEFSASWNKIQLLKLKKSKNISLQGCKIFSWRVLWTEISWPKTSPYISYPNP